MAPNIEKYPKGYRFIWADKAALAVALILFLFLVYAWLLTFASVGSLGAYHVWKDVGVGAIKFDLLIAGAVWIALRCIDFAIGGSTYRLFIRRFVARKARKESPAPYDLPIAYDRKIPRFEASTSFLHLGK